MSAISFWRHHSIPMGVVHGWRLSTKLVRKNERVYEKSLSVRMSRVVYV